MPEDPAMRGLHRAAGIDNLRAELRELAGSGHCLLIDGWDWFGEDAFPDAVHLGPPAARLFCQRLGQELQVTWQAANFPRQAQ
jgi:hypothetical protein